jgi:hypothetical protein
MCSLLKLLLKLSVWPSRDVFVVLAFGIGLLRCLINWLLSYRTKKNSCLVNSICHRWASHFWNMYKFISTSLGFFLAIFTCIVVRGIEPTTVSVSVFVVFFLPLWWTTIVHPSSAARASLYFFSSINWWI